MNHVETALFSASLISPKVQASLPKGYVLRPLQSGDYERGFLDVLKVLTEVGDHTKAQWLERFNYLKQHSHEYFTIVIVEEAKNKVVAAGSILVERKFVHLNGLVGHIEDIAVDANQQGKKFGIKIIEALKYIGENTGCYKVILDCSEKNIPFYEKCGFSHKEYEMVWRPSPSAKL
ncbi:acyl-CoA N-acyltransferase [Umbelopsis sp. AD052]|nr:acyl-CoA N-acyltransferase [Umbelopsis sp. AD052]